MNKIQNIKSFSNKNKNRTIENPNSTKKQIAKLTSSTLNKNRQTNNKLNKNKKRENPLLPRSKPCYFTKSHIQIDSNLYALLNVNKNKKCLIQFNIKKYHIVKI